MHAPAKSQASEMVPKCVEPKAELQLPLRASDLTALASSKRRAQDRLLVVQEQLDSSIRKWHVNALAMSSARRCECENGPSSLLG